MKNNGIYLILFSFVLACTSQDYMKAFAPADEGMIRYVLNIPKQKDESAHKIELIIGKTVFIDTMNRYFFSGDIEKQTVKGWGFNYYIVKSIGPMAGTLMAVPPGTPSEERFVRMRGEPFFLPYNSRLPLVVYVPQGVEVLYRIWNAEPEVNKIEER